ncbi:ankyrin repeat domain-containing protein [Anabaena lutea]|uniref:Ankyrin repeat domain-containing protein n=1 Tax=Anabaena lutea FACHB-196 TaxID=2692881 RepID=A0ABR8FIL7_9NOST|nr:ankyrin repeat domain-containing protein [Anabaena lutea]MBD2568541.1 ankyrin repeat domain-containing protein [Anabaena lutea FACHB-196]
MELLHESGYIIAERYRIIETLGQGGIGTTYQAEDLQNSQRVALKALSLKGMSDWKMTELFEREARVLSVLNHPGIPKYIDYFQVDTESDHGFYIAQQLAPGKSLAVLVEAGWHANEAEVRYIAIQILEILVYLHKQTPPVIHRDIKPQNIIRDDKGQVFLVDFGAVQDTYQSTFARSSTVVGTFGYMAPEQFRGQAVPTTDLYGLGATLLFLLTHRSPADLPQDRLKIDFRSRVQISGDFADFLEKLLEPDVEDRFVSAKEALDVLRGKRNLAGKSGAGLSWKTLLGVGFAGIVGFLVLNSFKYTILKSIGIKPEMCEPIRNSQTDFVRSYLNQGGDANNIDPHFNNSLLNCALKYNKKDIVELLIAKGADVNAKTNWGHPLHNVHSKEIAELLIDKGADINTKNNQGQTPLHNVHSREIAELLIAKGADVNAKDHQGQTPLSSLSQQYNSNNNKEIAELLIAKGADVNTKNNQGQTPLHQLLQYNSNNSNNKKEIAELLIAKGADVNTKNNQGQTPLHLWLQQYNSNNNKEIAELLIAKGADINAKNNQGQTPLHLWLQQYNSNNNKEIAELLIAKGADINAKTNGSQTLVQKAFENRNFSAVVYLIEKGAQLSNEDIKAKNNQGDTLLHQAGLDGSKKVVQLLLGKGADVNAKDDRDATPLHWAAWYGRKEVVELLLGKGADVNAKDNKGSTPLQIAISLKEIKRYNNEYKQTIKLLIAKGAEINIKDILGYERTPLHLAAMANWPDVAEMLISKKAKINVKNVYGRTPLHNAASNSSKDVVEVLLAKGKDLQVNSRDNNGFTPLGLAEANNRLDIVELLKSHGGIE